MKKYFFQWLVILMASFVSVNLVSCGDDDENRPQKVENPEDNLPESSRKFIGYWVCSSDAVDFIFYPNGTCKSYYYGFEKSAGYWTFNAGTNILSTTIGSWQWEVTLSNDESWAGISLGTGKALSYKKDDIAYVLYYIQSYIENTTWEGNGKTFNLYKVYPRPGYHYIETSDFLPKQLLGFSYGYKFDNKFYITGVEISGNTISITKGKINQGGKGEEEIPSSSLPITIKNFDKDNASMIIKDKEYFLKKEESK